MTSRRASGRAGRRAIVGAVQRRRGEEGMKGVGGMGVAMSGECARDQPAVRGSVKRSIRGRCQNTQRNSRRPLNWHSGQSGQCMGRGGG